MVRESGKRIRVYLEIPTGAASRAHALQRLLDGAGRVEEGTLHIEGRDLPRAMQALGFPESVLREVRQIRRLRGTPGVVTPESQLEDRAEAVQRLREAVKTAAMLVLR